MAAVAIVDDHPVVHRGMADILAGTDLRIVASVTRVADLAAPATVDLVVLDLYLQGEAGQPSIDAIVWLRQSTRVLVMSASAKPADVAAAMRDGANGYVTKNADPAMIVSSARTVAAGGFAMSPELADILLHVELGQVPGHGTDISSGDDPPLSPREREVLSWIARGFTHAQTATRMGIRKTTVDTYVERIRDKLRLGNKAELTRYAMEKLFTKLVTTGR